MGQKPFNTNRRTFLGAFATRQLTPARAAVSPDARREMALQLRLDAARRQAIRPFAAHSANGDEERLPSRVANFSKGLPHNQLGEVEAAAYESLLRAVHSGKPDDFAKIARGSGARLVNPQAGFAFSLEGADPQGLWCPPAPSITSDAAAAEMVELYWQALARDVPFSEYEVHPITHQAAIELAKTRGYSGPEVTPRTLFRGVEDGNLQGPYVSQFLLKPIPYFSGLLDQKWRVPAADADYVTNYGEWLAIQTGVPPWREARWDQERRYIRNGRDLAEVAHYDFLYQLVLHAALILLDARPENVLRADKNYFAESNPYKHSKVQCGFVTFGAAQVTDWVARVTTAALKPTWCQKWLVHRRLRPEQFAGRVHHTKLRNAEYPVPVSLLESDAVAETFARMGSYLLPQSYPEGCPLHPAYPAGHATAAGAGVTVLKALFDENAIIADSVVPSQDGTELLPYTEETLTVGNELNKLAFNIGMGRNFAGIHYRSDATVGMGIGEELAISVLEDLALSLPEQFGGFELTRFDGRRVRIVPNHS